MPEAFVTGATGLLGSVLVRRLLQKGWRVRALRRPTSSLALVEDIAGGVRWVVGDLLNPTVLREGMRGVDIVFHCAAKVSFSTGHRQRLYEINVEGTRLVVDVAMEVGVPRLVHVSSVAALGRHSSGIPIDETNEMHSPNEAPTHYSASKFLGEKEVWRAIAEGLNAVIVNPSVILGQGNWTSDSSQIVALGARGIPFYPTGGSGFVDAEDVAEVMIRLADTSIVGERFIVSAENWLYRDVLSFVAECAQKPPPRVPLPVACVYPVVLGDWLISRAIGRPPRWSLGLARQLAARLYYNNWKVRSTLNYQFRPLNETLAHLTEAYLRKRGHQ